MLVAMICCLLLMAGGIIACVKFSASSATVAASGFTAAVITGVALFVLTVSYFLPGLGRDEVSTVYVERPLRALRMDKSQGSTQGSFFLGCGSISSDEGRRYFWWYEQRDETVAYCQEWCQDTLLIETDEAPKVVRYLSHTYWTWMNGYKMARRPRRYVKLYVPKGSVLEAWKVQ